MGHRAGSEAHTTSSVRILLPEESLLVLELHSRPDLDSEGMIDWKLWTLGKYYAVHTGWGEDTVRHRKLPGGTGVREMHQGQNSTE